MTETVDGAETDALELFQLTMMQLESRLELDITERLAVQRRYEEAEVEFYGKILKADPQRWADIFLGGRAVDELNVDDANALFNEIRALFRECLLSAGSCLLSVEKNQVDMPLSELAATDPAVQAGWMQTQDQNPDAKAGHVTTSGADGQRREVGTTDTHFLVPTQEGLRLLQAWTDVFGEPSEHQFVRRLTQGVHADAAQIVE